MKELTYQYNIQTLNILGLIFLKFTLLYKIGLLPNTGMDKSYDRKTRGTRLFKLHTFRKSLIKIKANIG